MLAAVWWSHSPASPSPRHKIRHCHSPSQCGQHAHGWHEGGREAQAHCRHVTRPTAWCCQKMSTVPACSAQCPQTLQHWCSPSQSLCLLWVHQYTPLCLSLGTLLLPRCPCGPCLRHQCVSGVGEGAYQVLRFHSCRSKSVRSSIIPIYPLPPLMHGWIPLMSATTYSDYNFRISPSKQFDDRLILLYIRT